jgi:hypothetical protein
MHSVPFYGVFLAAGASAYRPHGEPAPARPGLLRRVLDAIERSRQRAANREIARIVGGLGPDDRLTDEMERRVLQHLTGDRGFRP